MQREADRNGLSFRYIKSLEGERKKPVASELQNVPLRLNRKTERCREQRLHARGIAGSGHIKQRIDIVACHRESDGCLLARDGIGNAFSNERASSRAVWGRTFGSFSSA